MEGAIVLIILVIIDLKHDEENEPKRRLTQSFINYFISFSGILKIYLCKK